MSCNTIYNGRNINYEKVGPYGNSSGSFATLDTAFAPSATMSDFQNRMASHNPLMTQKSVNNETSNINDNIQMLMRQQDDILISPQSEEKINNNVDMMVGALYNRNNDYSRQNDMATLNQYMYPHIPVVQNDINFPLTRAQHYPAQQYGTELLEDFNLQQDAQNLNSTSRCMTGMNLLKFILLIILIAALIYGIYWLYKGGSDTKNTTYTSATKSIYAPTKVGSATSSSMPTSSTNVFEKLIQW